MPWLHVEPFHFADAVAELPDGHAADRLIVFNDQEYWSIVPLRFQAVAL
jgi:hypothetical protein